MVVGAFPIAKLSVLLIKQISKPIANACKNRAKSHPFFRKYVCMPPAQFYNWCEIKAKMWILNLGKPVNIPVLSQDMAIELGANLLGETVIFVIGALLLVVEYQRQSIKEAKNVAKKDAETAWIQDSIRDLFFTVQQQGTQLRELERTLYEATGKHPEHWTPPQIPEYKPPPPEEQDESDEEEPQKPHEEPKKPDGEPPKNSEPPKSPPEPYCDSFNAPKKPTPCSYTIAPYEDEYSEVPYPNRNLIMRSLNYLHVDIMSQVRNKQVYSDYLESSKRKLSNAEYGIVTSAVADLENEFKTLF